MLAAGSGIDKFGVLKDDIFFVDSGHSIVIQQWLYDLIVYKIYSILGKPGILLFVLLLVLFFIFLITLIFKLFDINLKLALTSALLICVYCREVLSVRPGLITMILLLIQVYWCEKYIRTGKYYFLLFLPLLTLLDINLHSAIWIVHFIFLLPYIVPIPQIIKKHVSVEDHHISIFKLALPILLMIASLFINPYGIDSIMILFNQSEISSLGIIEVNSPTFSSRYAAVLILMLLIVAFSYGKTVLHSSNLFMFIGTALMMMNNLRNIQLFSIGLVLILCDLLVVVKLDKLTVLLKNTKNLIVSLSFALVVVCIILSASQFPFVWILRDQPSDSVATPVLAVDYLDTYAAPEARIYTDFNNGSYISWMGYKIYFSSRTEQYCQAINGGYDLVGEYLTVFYNTDVDNIDSFDSFLEKYDFDYLVVDSRNRMFPYLMTNQDFEAVVYGNGYVLFKAS